MAGMYEKPPACRGCPFYGTGWGFVPDRLQEGASVFIMGQNPGAQEEQDGKPFVGPTGKLLDQILPLAKLTRESVSIGNALRCRVEGRDTLPPVINPTVQEAIQHCTRRHFTRPAGVALYIAQGAYALWALTGHGAVPRHGVQDWRGYLAPLVRDPRKITNATAIWTPGPKDTPVLVTAHLAVAFRSPEMLLSAQRDWGKVPAILKGQWPRKLPAWGYTVAPKLGAKAPIAFDTEYSPVDKVLFRYSLRQDDRLYVNDGPPWPALALPSAAPVVMHNAEADLAHLGTVATGSPLLVEDTMYMHSVLWSGMPHDLGFLGSFYGSLNRWKHLIHDSPIEYSAADAWVTGDVYAGLLKEFQQDPESWQVYTEYTRPLVPIIQRARRYGIALDQARIKAVLAELTAKTQGLQLKAQAAAGWPLNIASSQQTAAQLFQIEKLRAPRW